MKGGISVLVGALLVVFSLTMVAEGQRKNRIRGNQGRRSVGKPDTTNQRKRTGTGAYVDGAPAHLRRGSKMLSGSHAGDYDMRQRKRQGQPSMILDDTTNPSLRDNGDVERNRRKRR